MSIFQLLLQLLSLKTVGNGFHHQTMKSQMWYVYMGLLFLFF